MTQTHTVPTKTRRSFGHELKSILSADSFDLSDPKEQRKDSEFKQVMTCQMISGRFQPRKNFDPASLQALSNSIASQGLLQPIIVRQINTNEYEIIAGERRWRAAQMANIQQVPVIISEISDEAALAFGLIENIQRENLNPIETATALKKLLEGFNMTHAQIAESIGYSRAMVTNMLRLLNLTPAVQQLLIARKIEIGHAKILVTLQPKEQESIAETIIDKHMSVRSVERLVRLKKQQSGGTLIKKKSLKLHKKCHQWSRVLSKKLSTKTSVHLNEAGEGSITIRVHSESEIEWLIAHFKV